MTDIVERLSGQGCSICMAERKEAADEIERLRGRVTEAENRQGLAEHMQANLHGHIKRLEDENSLLRAENAKLRETLGAILDTWGKDDVYPLIARARAALQKDKGE